LFSSLGSAGARGSRSSPHYCGGYTRTGAELQLTAGLRSSDPRATRSMIDLAPCCFFFSCCFSFVAGSIGREEEPRRLSGASPHMRGAFGGGSVRVREPRPEPMRKWGGSVEAGRMITRVMFRVVHRSSPRTFARGT
jgi:hypothetical protein